jgi:hypothetical protein
LGQLWRVLGGGGGASGGEVGGGGVAYASQGGPGLEHAWQFCSSHNLGDTLTHCLLLLLLLVICPTGWSLAEPVPPFPGESSQLPRAPWYFLASHHHSPHQQADFLPPCCKA